MVNNVNNENERKLKDMLKDYSGLPEYSGMEALSVSTKSLFNDYPINIAATRGISDEISLLIANGADINTKGEHGYTPLHDAVEQGHMEVVKLLLTYGADKSIKNDDGTSPAGLAELLGETEIHRYLIGNQEPGKEDVALID